MTPHPTQRHYQPKGGSNIVNIKRSIELQHQMDILQIRQQALRVAIALFEQATAQDDLLEIGAWLDQSAIATDANIVQEAYVELVRMARRKNINY